jgi:hypothetical protein
MMDDDRETAMTMKTNKGNTDTNTNPVDGSGHKEQMSVSLRNNVKRFHHRKDSADRHNTDFDCELF